MKRLLCSIISFLCVGSIFAANTEDLYDGLYGRPSYFPEFTVPTTWPNNMTCYAQAIGTDGKKLENYEVAVFDQDNALRAIGRSIASQGELCPLTILGTEGDVFHFIVLSGDFKDPDIQQTSVTQTFKTNLVISPSQPIQLNTDAVVLSMNRTNGAGFATYSAAYPVKPFSQDVGAYKAQVVGDQIVLKRLYGSIPAGTGFVLFGSGKGDQYVYLQKNTTGTTADITDNDLLPTTTASEPLAIMPTSGYNFALGDGNEFRLHTGVNFLPNRAYIHLDYNPVTSETEAIQMVFAEESGIEQLQSDDLSSSDGKWFENGRVVIVKQGKRYNLNGQKIGN